MSLLHLDVTQVHKLVNGLSKALPGSAGTLLTDAVKSATTRTSSGSLATVIIAILISVWSAGGRRAGRPPGRPGQRPDRRGELRVPQLQPLLELAPLE